MITEKLRKRAQALARMGAGKGPEAKSARRRLDAMVNDHPALSYLLDEDAMTPTEVAVDVPTPMHAYLLMVLCETRGCDTHTAPIPGTEDQIPLARWSVHGIKADVLRTLEEYDLHRDALLALFDVLADTYMAGVLSQEIEALDEAEDLLDESDDEEIEQILASLADADLDEPTAHDLYEQARREHLNKLIARLPTEAVRKACERLVHLSTPTRGTPAVMLPGRAMAWNDPEMTWEEFLACYRAMVPGSKLLDYELLYQFRDGFRLYPPTRRLRSCPELAKSEDWTP